MGFENQRLARLCDWFVFFGFQDYVPLVIWNGLECKETRERIAREPVYSSEGLSHSFLAPALAESVNMYSSSFKL